jgi:myosin heavy subunit
VAQFQEEGLNAFLQEITFSDNQPVIDLLEKAPMGIFNLIDES